MMLLDLLLYLLAWYIVKIRVCTLLEYFPVVLAYYHVPYGGALTVYEGLDICRLWKGQSIWFLDILM